MIFQSSISKEIKISFLIYYPDLHLQSLLLSSPSPLQYQRSSWILLCQTQPLQENISLVISRFSVLIKCKTLLRNLFSGTSWTYIILSHLVFLVFTLITFFLEDLPLIPPEISQKMNCTYGASLFYMLQVIFRHLTDPTKAYSLLWTLFEWFSPLP